MQLTIITMFFISSSKCVYLLIIKFYPSTGLPWWFRGKESACSAGDMELIPGLGRSPGEGNGRPLQYSCLENPTDRGARWATVHGAHKRVGHNLVTKQQLPLNSRTQLKRRSSSSTLKRHSPNSSTS